MAEFPAPPPAIGSVRPASTEPGRLGPGDPAASGRRPESARFAPPYGVAGDFVSMPLVAAEYPTPVYRIPVGGLWMVIELRILAVLAAGSWIMLVCTIFRHYCCADNRSHSIVDMEFPAVTRDRHRGESADE